MPRSRRWDFLYDRERRPVREWLLDAFAAELARELGDAAHPERLLRAALAAARLDLARDWDGAEALVSELPEGDRAAARALVHELAEACLELKERVEGVRLSRAELSSALDRVERLVFRVS